MNQQKMITIIEARHSQSGKTLGIKGHDRVWYQTKIWDLENMIGQAIYAETSTSEFNGRTMHWINDFSLPDGTSHQPATAGAPAQQVQSAPKPSQSPAPALSRSETDQERTASIVAQALCKSLRFDSPQQAVDSYKEIYLAIVSWDGKDDDIPEDEPNDDIPF